MRGDSLSFFLKSLSVDEPRILMQGGSVYCSSSRLAVFDGGVFRGEHGPHQRARYRGSLFTLFFFVYFVCVFFIFLTFWFLSQLVSQVVG